MHLANPERQRGPRGPPSIWRSSAICPALAGVRACSPWELAAGQKDPQAPRPAPPPPRGGPRQESDPEAPVAWQEGQCQVHVGVTPS